ncbi:Uncharacterised protein [Escherichia coli]|nr:Uncharacterised protein [Escherichia coli]
MLKTDSLREAMTVHADGVRPTRKNSPFSWRAATLKRPEKRPRLFTAIRW